MAEYILYLDESYTHSNRGQSSAFAIGGVILKNTEINNVAIQIDNVKAQIWNDLPNYKSIILHELDLKRAVERHDSINTLKKEYERFRRNSDSAKLIYKEFAKIIRHFNIVTLGCVLKQDDFYTNFFKDIRNDISLVCMQIIIENYTHFLCQKKATGKIIYESRDEADKTMLMRFHQVCAIGTMYVKPLAIQQRITQFQFKGKQINDPCLQLADFIPNLIARNALDKKIYKDTKPLLQAIWDNAYKGINNNRKRYGIKTVPRVN